MSNLNASLLFILSVHVLPIYAFEMQKLLANDSIPNNQFGVAVSVHNKRALIGSHYDDINNNGNAGSAYIYTMNATEERWMQTAKLTANDGKPNDMFGISVALHENTAIIGAYQGDIDGNVSNSGAAYIFNYNESSLNWTQSAKLVASDGSQFDYFGYSVAVHDVTAVVGAYKNNGMGDESGSAYIFHYDNITETWNEKLKLLPPDGNPSDHFGFSVSLDKHNIIIGAQRDDFDAGSTYIWNLIDGAWTNKTLTKLVADDRQQNNNFGHSVSISGNYAFIGAWRDDDIGYDEGSVYVFYYNETLEKWNQTQQLYGYDTSDLGTRFGNSVVVDGEHAIIGGYRNDEMGYESGSAYIFTLNESNRLWQQTAKILANDAAADDKFGYSVALDGYNAIIGSPWASGKGATYMVRNYENCNETIPQTVNQQYIINWRWTVCFTAPPTTHPTAEPTLEPTFNPTINPTAITTNPTLGPTVNPTTVFVNTAIWCEGGYGVGIHIKFKLKLNYTSNITTQISDALKAAINEEIDESDIQLQLQSTDYEISVTDKDGVILIHANISVCNIFDQTILIAELGNNNLETTFINKVNDMKLIVHPDDIDLDLVTIGKASMVTTKTIINELITSDINRKRSAGNDDIFWIIIWIVLAVVLCCITILAGIMIHKYRKDRNMSSYFSDSGVVMTQATKTVDTSLKKARETEQDDLINNGIDNDVIDIVNQTDNGQNDFIVDGNIDEENNDFTTVGEENDEGNDIGDNDIVDLINQTDDGGNDDIQNDFTTVGKENNINDNSIVDLINQTRTNDGKNDHDNLVNIINQTDCGGNNDDDNLVNIINQTDIGQNTDNYIGDDNDS